jgi:hypothetical protein
MIPIYTGFDRREEVGWHTFAASVMHRTTAAVGFIPLSGPQRNGSNAFTYTRFLVPFLQKYEGWAIFADACDMVCLADIADLWALRDARYAVQVVKHDYQTKHPIKYVGTEMESPNVDYPKKNWASLMLINCEHKAWRRLEIVEAMERPEDMIRLLFLHEDEIGELPAVWNWLADERDDNPSAKIVHWTAGIPAFPHYAFAPMADLWAAEAVRVTHATR